MSNITCSVRIYTRSLHATASNSLCQTFAARTNVCEFGNPLQRASTRHQHYVSLAQQPWQKEAAYGTGPAARGQQVLPLRLEEVVPRRNTRGVQEGAGFVRLEQIPN